MAADYIDVTVKVPVDRLADFYEGVGRWLDGAVDLGRPSAEARRDDGPAISSWDPAEDLDLAVRAWSQFPERARLLFSTLIDHPDRRFSGAQLAELHDIPNGMYGVAGVWAWPGRQLRALGRPLPFDVRSNPAGGSLYAMSPRIADLFARARRVAEAD